MAKRLDAWGHRRGPILFLLLGAAVALPASIFGVVAWADHRRVMAEAEAAVERALFAVHGHAQKVFETQVLVLDQAERLVGEAGVAGAQEGLAALGHGLPHLDGVWTLAADGATRRPARPDRVFSAAEREAFQAHRDRGERLFVGTLASASGEQLLALSRRLPDAEGRFVGAVFVGTRAGYLTDHYARIAPGARASAGLYRADGRVLVRYPRLDAEHAAVLPPAGPAGHGVGRQVSALDGVERLFAYAKLPGLPVYAGFGLAVDEVLAPWRGRLWIYGALCGLVAVLLSGSAVAGVRRAAREEEATQAWYREARRRADAEETLVQTQKMQALGQLTGGVAHEYNNLLTAVTVNLHLATPLVPEGGRRFLDGAGQATERAAKLTRQLLAFSRQEAVNPEAVELNAALRGMALLIEKSVRADTRIVFDLSEDAPVVEVDPVQLELAVFNVVLNARDAMGAAAGRLTVATRAVDLHGRADGLEGAFVALEIADDGCGMPADVQARAFEPFFTTKDVGKGSGLGLSMVYGFARQSGGGAEIESGVGHGTRVRILLPRSLRLPAGAEAGGAAATCIGHARVLVVEDNALVLMATVEVLKAQGLQVLTAEDGQEALEVLARERDIAAVVSDIVMPRGVSGLDLRQEVRRRWPHIRVLLTSGYSREVLATMGADRDVALLPKPFTPEDLASRLFGLFRDAPRGGKVHEFPTGRMRRA